MSTIGYGSIDQGLVDLTRNNFADAKFARLSFSTTPIEILANDESQSVLTHATGFFWREGKNEYVITNWHALSGRNPLTKLLLSESGLIPKIVRVYGWAIEGAGEKVGLKRTSWTITLPDTALLALEEPPLIAGHITDLTALPLPNDFAIRHTGTENSMSNIRPCINDIPSDRISTEAGDECVLLGYPLKNYSGLRLPLWKRGSISSDTNTTVDNLPAFLLDAATSSAMSGSPVLRRSAPLVSMDANTKVILEHRGFELIGVYGGRLQNKQLEQIGIGYAWLATSIQAAIQYSLATVWKTPSSPAP